MLSQTVLTVRFLKGQKWVSFDIGEIVRFSFHPAFSKTIMSRRLVQVIRELPSEKQIKSMTTSETFWSNESLPSCGSMVQFPPYGGRLVMNSYSVKVSVNPYSFPSALSLYTCPPINCAALNPKLTECTPGR